jgi:hypothetical protein
MLTVEKVVSQKMIISQFKTIHRRKEDPMPEDIEFLYRPFWLGRMGYNAKVLKGADVKGTVIFLADARIFQWGTLGIWKYWIENPFDLREHKYNFVVTDKEDLGDTAVLEPIFDEDRITKNMKLYNIQRVMQKTLKLFNIEFTGIEYWMVYRPYWQIKFTSRFGKEDLALFATDNVLLRQKV